MYKVNRRKFIRGLGTVAGGAAIAASTGCVSSHAMGRGGHVVVVGGGTGGATTAKYLRRLNENVQVTLIEANPVHHTCYLSNEVLSGDRSLDDISVGYDGLKAHGVKVIIDKVTGIDPDAKTVSTAGGDKISYDRCVVSPGVDFKWEAIQGYDAATSERTPHAWKAGPQTLTLRKQLVAMDDGGTVAIVAPPNPFRCPPGPYERASQIAMYFKHHKPKSKILILDPKDAFSKQGLFKQAWSKMYGYDTDNSMIEWVGGAGGGKVLALKSPTLLEGDVEDFKADVINIIPPQKAGMIAFNAGLVDGDWCPVDKKTFESTIHKNIHVIGDASSAAKMPKSGYAANSQAKVCAAAVVDLLAGRDPGEPSYVNTCYSIAGEDYGFSVAAVYRLDAGANMINGVKGAGGLTPMDADAETLKREVAFAHSWYYIIVHDSFG